MPDVLEQVGSQRQSLMSELETILADASAAGRDLSADEAERYDAGMEQIEKLDARIDGFAAAREREARNAEYLRGLSGDASPRVQITSEPRTYTKETERAGGSFLRDLVNAPRGDAQAAERLGRHQRETALEYETRDVGTGAFAGLTVPQYLTDLVAPLRRAGRPLADICNRHDLPPEGMTVNISRITTGTAVAAQATENAAAQETDADDTLLTVNVRTIAGMQDVSRQVIDRSRGGDEIVIADLMRAYNTEQDRQIINADGTSGTHLGIRSTAGIIAVSYTDATPTGAEAWPKLWDLVSQIQSGVFLGVSHFVTHPRRFWWLVSQVGTSFPFIQVYPGATVQAGSTEGTGTYENGIAGRLGPVPVILDGNIPTNLGAGTNEDVLLGVTNGELHLWEDPAAPLLIRTDEALSNQLSVRFVLFGYSAFTAGRYPGAQGTIGGTGFVLPVF